MPDIARRLKDALDALNEAQREAVTHEGTRLLILAGAGSGKTRVVTTRIAWLIGTGIARPESILAVTFTNKAAREMRERAVDLEPLAAGVAIRTFHSFGAWFLRRNAALAGLDPRFRIYDDEDSLTLLSTLVPDAPKTKLVPYARAISRAKDYCIGPDDPDFADFSGLPKARERYAAYEKRLREMGNCDFGDLILRPLELLRAEPAVRDRTRQRFSVILVDEYQDSNVAQFELLRELAGESSSVCVVGDDDQSIYRFRGAEVRNILEFPNLFPGTHVVRLEENYRSRAGILAVADSVVAKNRGRLGKTLRATREGGTPPVLRFLPSQEDEAAYVAGLVEAHAGKGGAFSDWAVLYRTNAQSLAFEQEFLRRRLPYKVVGSLKFYEREEVKDSLALLSLIANSRDEVAFRRVANKPSRGLGEQAMAKICQAERESGSGFLDPRLGQRAGLSPKAAKGLAAFQSALGGVRELLGEPGPLPEDWTPESSALDKPMAGGLDAALERLLSATGLLEHFEGADEIEGTQRRQNLDELANAAAYYPLSHDGLAAFLEHVELDRSMSDADAEAIDAVTLITMHNTKGLEFRKVAVTGLEQGLFPRDDDKDDELEEQRRLFYVAATRAMDELYLTGCRYRRVRGSFEERAPSRFISEIGEGLVMDLDGAMRAKIPTQGYDRGQRVYHDAYGPGTVLRAEAVEGNLVVEVRFDSGRWARFFPKYTRLERIAD